MEGHDNGVARRTVLMSAGVGIGAGLVSGLSSAQAQGRSRRGRGEAEIWSSDYWANKGGVKLNLWRKRVGAPKAGEKPLPILFLVHGSSNSTRSSYDLTVPGKGEYSLMNVMARDGYDVWTMDHDGYGHSGSSGNNSDIASGVEDLKAAMPVVHEGNRPAEDAHVRHLVGRHPRRGLRPGAAGGVDRLILSAFTYKGEGAAGDRAAAGARSMSSAPTRGASATRP